MATLQKIRNRGTLLMLIIGIALFAFIIGDAINNSSSYFGNAENMIGEVDGEPIPYLDYRKEVTTNIQQAEGQRGRISDQERDMIEAQTWNQMVEKIILGKSEEDLGITVTTDELSHIFLKKTDEVVKRAFGDADEAAIALQISTVENGSDPNAKRQFLQFKNYVKDKRQKDKFFGLLSKGLTRNTALSTIANTSGKVNFRYIRKDYNTIPDSTIEVSDKEIRKYYEQNKALFKQIPARNISYIKIDVTPSAEDLAFSKQSFAQTRTKFREATNPMRFASVNSDLKPDARYWKKEEIRDEALAAFIFSQEAVADKVYGPYGNGYTMQLARVADRKMMPDSVKASHILLRETKNTKTLTDSIVNALKNGADFATLAKKYSEDKGSSEKGGDLGWFGKGRMIPAFQDAAFQTAKGEITTVNTQFGTHIIKVLDKGKDFENVQIAIITKETTPSNKTFQLALSEARHIAENIKNLDELSAVAQEKRLPVKDATFYAASTGLQEVPNSKELVRIAFNTEEANTLLTNKDNSTVFEFDECYIVAGLKDIKAGEYASLDDKQTRETILATIRKDKKAAQIKDALLATLKSGQNLEDIATKEGAKVESIIEATFDSNYLPGLGQEPEVIATAVLEKNKTPLVTTPIQGNQGVYIIGDIEKVEGTTPNYEAITSFYNQSLKTRATQQGYQALYENAEVTDERYRF